MNIRDRRSIYQTADHALEQAQGDPRKILLIYLGVVTALSLAASALSVLLSNRIADTGGLGNLSGDEVFGERQCCDLSPPRHSVIWV